MLAHAIHESILGSSLGHSVVVGLDGSPESLVAARQAATLVDEESSLDFVSAVAPFVTSIPAYGNVAALHELEEGARMHLREAQSRWPRADTTFAFGAAAEVVLDTVRRRQATLVAVGGRHRHRRVPGIVLGSVTTHVLHRAPCSVLVARERDGGLAFPRAIVVGTDGSPQGNTAVRVALELGERFDAPVRALIATGDGPVDAAAAAGVDVIEFSELPPVDALVGAAAGADLVVVGSRGLRGVRALGSVSERVGHTAPCSVLVVR